MDPVLHAAHTFLAQVDAFWRKHPARVQPLVGTASDRAEMLKALRLGERAPDNFRPLFLYEAPFEDTASYFRGLAEAIAHDYEQVRQGVADEGVELPAYITSPRDLGPLGGAALAMAETAALLGERFDGVTVALLPGHVVDESAWRGAVCELDRLPWSPRVRVAVHAPPEGPLDGVLQTPGAWFSVDLPALLEFLKGVGAVSAGPGPAGGGSKPAAPTPGEAMAPAPGEPPVSTRGEAARKLRALLLEAAAHTAAGAHTAAVSPYEQAAALCVTEQLLDEEAVVRMALGGAYMVANVPELAVESYCKAAGLAAALEAWSLSCVAWLGAGGTYLALGKDEPAAAAYEAASQAATKGELGVLVDEARRLRGECLRRLHGTDEADPGENAPAVPRARHAPGSAEGTDQ